MWGKMPIDCGGYRIVKATGRVAASSRYRDPTGRVHRFETRASAVRGGHDKMRYLAESDYRELGWDNVEEW